MRKPQGHFLRNAERQRNGTKPKSRASINRARDARKSPAMFRRSWLDFVAFKLLFLEAQIYG
jgi:hypothetical protein